MLRSLAIGLLPLLIFSSHPAQADDTAVATQPVLIAFDGIQQLAREASRQRMLSQVLKFKLEVGPDGKPIKCELARKFRRRYVEVALCRPLLEHHSFHPARNSAGEPVVGTYENTIDFRMWLKPDGNLEREARP